MRAYEHIALLIQHATRMRHIVTSCVAPLAPPYFSTLSHKRRDFLKKVTEHKMCVSIFSINFDTFLHLRRIQRDIAINIKRLHVKYPLFLSDFNKT